MKTKNIFISHSWKYDNTRERLTNLLNKREDFYWRDYSVPVDDPLHTNGTDGQLREKIAEQIRLSSIVIVLAGMYANYSKWMNIEIKIAKEDFLNPKRILAVKPWASKRTSDLVKENADKIVRWNTESIVGAIRNLT